MLFGILTKVGLFVLPAVGRLLGIHLFKAHLFGFSLNGLLAKIAVELGWRFFAGIAVGFYWFHADFKKGIDEAIGSLF